MHSIDGLRMMTQQSENGHHPTNTPFDPCARVSVLLVDDEEAIAELAQRMLEFMGYDVTAFTEGNYALKSYLAFPKKYDVVILDQSMPGRSGSEIASEILKIRPDMPIILMSGFYDQDLAAAAEYNGFSGFIAKPFVASELGQSICAALDAKRRV